MLVNYDWLCIDKCRNKYIFSIKSVVEKPHISDQFIDFLFFQITNILSVPAVIQSDRGHLIRKVHSLVKEISDKGSD